MSPRSYVTPLRKECRLPIVDDITSVLREWNTHLREKFRQSGDVSVLPDDQNIAAMPSEISGIMNEVMSRRKALVGGKLTLVERQEEQRRVNSKIDFLNGRLGMDLVVRDENGDRLTGASESAVAFYRQHSKQKLKNNFGDRKQIQQMMLDRRVTAPAPRQPVSSSSFRIMMEVKNCISQKVCDFVELDFSIYEAAEDGRYNMRPLCENFVAYWDRRNLDDPRRSREEMERRSNHRVLFTDIGKDDISKRFFLVCIIVSEGDYRMKEGERDSGRSTLGSTLNLREPEQDPYFRKPVGVAAVEITDMFTFKQGKALAESETEVTLPFMLMSNQNEPYEEVFRRLVFEKKPPTETGFLWVTLNVILGDALQPLDTRLLRHPVARKIGHPEVILPGDERNELYVNLLSGDFSRQERRISASDRSVEVIMKVCDKEGRAISNAISSGVGDARVGDAYRSLVFFHNQKPRWNEVTKIKVDADKFSGCHLQFTFTHRSANSDKHREPWAMSFLKLEQPRDAESSEADDQSNTALKDDKYHLIVYKVEKGFKMEPSAYLGLPYLKKQEQKLKQVKKGQYLTLLPNDEMVVETTLCSTQLTQNEGLRSLLLGKGNKEKLRYNLTAFTQDFDGREFVKFLPDAMDTLFSLLTETAESHEDTTKVFQTILMALEKITEGFQHFMPVLDDYIAEKFSATLAYSKLLEILKECVETQKRSEVLSAMKSLK